MAVGRGQTVGSVEIAIRGESGHFRKAMADMEAQAKRSSTNVQTSIAKANTEVRAMTGSVGMLTQAFALMGGVAIGSQMIKIADSFTQMRNKLSLVVKEGENLLDVEERLYQLAIKNRAALEPTVALYTRLRSARSDLSDAQALKIVDTWNKTLVISGASSQGAASATIQLAQAMASGTLRAEEFNSIVENNTRAVQLFAASLGVGMGELRAMVANGQVGFDQLVKAMTTDAGAVGDEFGRMSITVGQAMTNLETSMIRFVGLSDQQFEGSKKLAGWINILAENFETLATAILVAGASVASALGTQMLFGLARSMYGVAQSMLAAGSAAKALGLAMKWLDGPWGLALGALAAAAGSIAFSFMDLRTVSERTEDAMKGVAEQVKKTSEQLKSSGIKEFTADLNDAGQPIDAVTAKIAKLREEMEKTGRAAQQTLIDGQWAANFELVNQIAALQREMSRTRVTITRGGEWNERLANSPEQIAALQTKLDAARKRLAEGQASLSRLVNLSRGDVQKLASGDAQTAASASTAATTKTIQQLTGYYTHLEQLERSLADIRTAEAEGATGASRAAVQAMLDYLDATGDVVTVLERMRALSGNILDPKDARLIDEFVAASRMNALGNQSVGDLSGVNEIGGSGAPAASVNAETAWTGFEQRIADATKGGLLTAIETGDWGDAFGDILRDVTRDALSRAIDVLWDAISQIDWGGKGSGWGGFFNMIGSSFGMPPAGGRASGGPVTAGRKYRVGEMGSEWFVPNADGFIVPNRGGGAMGGKALGASVSVGGTVININGNADSVTVKQLGEVLEAHRKALPQMIDARVTDRQKRGAY